MAQNPLKITDTILRDAHQSQAATRMRIEDMLPACKVLDQMGYWSLECWGGATFDVCMRYLNEDPWERLRTLRKALPNTKLQMLLRGQNLLGYKHYADDVVEQFVKKSVENGIDVIRIFDALNDPRNMEAAMKYTKYYGGMAEATISYTTSPVHDMDYFVRLACQLQDMGADTICIKDMANLLLPYTAYELVSRLKKELSIPIHLHTHNTTGTGDMVYLKAAEAGVDIVDTALSPMANGTSQPTTESLVATLQGTDRDTGLDLNKLSEAAAHFRKVAQRLQDEGSLRIKSYERLVHDELVQSYRIKIEHLLIRPLVLQHVHRQDLSRQPFMANPIRQIAVSRMVHLVHPDCIKSIRSVQCRKVIARPGNLYLVHD